jgi:hypothetical protein
MPSVFISHSHEDKTFADRLERALRDDGVDTWIDDHTGAGSSIISTVKAQIRCINRVLLCSSKSSLTSGWVAEEIELCLKRERKEKQTVLILLSLDDFARTEWKSDLRQYFSDRLVVPFDMTTLKTEAFEDALKLTLQAIRTPLSHTPLIHGTWSYLIDNSTVPRLLVGAFRIDSESHGLIVPEGLVFNVSSEEPGHKTLWGKWKSDLVAYDGEELGIFFDSEHVNRQQQKPPHERLADGAWRLRHDSLTSLFGRAYHSISALRNSDIGVKLRRLDIRLQNPPNLQTCLEGVYQELYSEEVRAIREIHATLQVNTTEPHVQADKATSVLEARP